MKRMLSLLLAAALLLGLAACGADKSPATEPPTEASTEASAETTVPTVPETEPSTEAPTEEPAPTEPDLRGYCEDGVYINPVLNLAFPLGDGWGLGGEELDLDLLGLAEEENFCFQASLEEDGEVLAVLGMIAVRVDLLEAKMMEETSQLERQAQQLREAFSRFGGDIFRLDYTTASLAGEDCEAISFRVTDPAVGQVYALLVFQQMGSHMVMLTLSGTREDLLTGALSRFYALKK